MVPHDRLHLLTNGKGLKLFGRGGWNEEKHGRAHRSWRKLHLAVGAGTGEMVSSTGIAEASSQRKRHIPLVAEKSRMAWKKEAGHGCRSLAETTAARYTTIVGSRLRAHLERTSGLASRREAARGLA
ncbi:hypothetical protein JMJ55_22955 [Belnapia sp. T6]|uniref:Transposase n=1 Tax=Belnapia mucosa TaxID=2804532 RepID=A0ABS1V944_9PROT|nr:hypothetical protein [Belnapia mucosa]MBL6458201.1 hypothetical protein [Belnapia mucosa]